MLIFLFFISYFFLFFFFCNDTATTEIYTLSLHDALPILDLLQHHRHLELGEGRAETAPHPAAEGDPRSEEHTSELQSRRDLVCRLLLEKKKKKKKCFRAQKKKKEAKKKE